MFVDLGIQRAIRMRNIDIRGLSGSKIFIHIIPQTTIFKKKKWNKIKKKLLNTKCVLIFSTTFVWNISHSKKNWARWSKTYIGLHVKYPLLLSHFYETWIFSKYFGKCRNIKFYENQSTGSQVISCGRTVGPTDMMKVTGAFRNFPNAPKTSASQYIRVFACIQL